MQAKTRGDTTDTHTYTTHTRVPSNPLVRIRATEKKGPGGFSDASAFRCIEALSSHQGGRRNIDI